MPDEVARRAREEMLAGSEMRTPPRPAIARPVEYVIVAVGLLLSVLLFLLYGKVADLVAGQDQVQQTQADGKERTFQSRAIQCDLAKGIGVTEPAECADPETARYRDPQIVEGSSASARQSKTLREVICAVLMQAQENPDSTLVLPPDLCR